MVLEAGQPYFLRVQFAKNVSSSVESAFAVTWAAVTPGGPPPASTAFVPIPQTALLAPSPDHPQMMRFAAQRKAASGWGAWHRPSALAATLLPEGATLTVGLCQVSVDACMDPTAVFTPEQDRGQEEPKSDAVSRPGVYAWDRSYWQLYLTWHGLNVSLEWSGTNANQLGGDQDVSVVATVVDGNASDFTLLLTGSFVFERGGDVETSDTTVSLNPGGSLRRVAVAAFSGHGGASPLQRHAGEPTGSVRVSLMGSAAASTNLRQFGAIVAAVNAARSAAVFRVGQQSLAPGLQRAGTAMQSCLMWNVIYDPMETAPFVQVSRSFTFQPCEETPRYLCTRTARTNHTIPLQHTHTRQHTYAIHRPTPPLPANIHSARIPLTTLDSR
jgi:hypothetical protein